MFQIFVVGNPFQFLLNNLLDFLLDSPVILLHRFLHAVVTFFVREVGNYGYLHVGFLHARQLLGNHDQHTVKNHMFETRV